MNIFFLDNDPQKIAEYHCDKHVVKMILETAQLLCGVHHMTPQVTPQVPYKLSHKNHPCSIWARESFTNYLILCEVGLELCKEYTYRYGKIHKCERDGLVNRLQTTPVKIPIGPFTEPTPAMPDEVKIAGDSIKSYRNYYINNKTHLASRKKRSTPGWYNANI